MKNGASEEDIFTKILRIMRPNISFAIEAELLSAFWTVSGEWAFSSANKMLALRALSLFSFFTPEILLLFLSLFRANLLITFFQYFFDYLEGDA